MAFFAMAPVDCPTRPLPRATVVSPWIDSMAQRIKSPAEAPALPFVPFAVKGTRELKAMLAERRVRRNRTRHRPPLALALVGLLASNSAMLVSSSAGESALTASVPVIRRCASDVESALVDAVAREHGLSELSFNDAVNR